MIQLWLDGKRIDSVQQLRRAFAACASERLEMLGRELLEKMADGLLLPWLDRCNETRLITDAWERKTMRLPADGGLASCRVQLGAENAESLSDEGLAALARICAVDVGVLRKAREMRKRHDERFPCADVKRQVEAQAWYRADARVRQMLADVRWACVVLNSSMLTMVLARHKDRAAGEPLDVYLCNVGEVFMVRAPLELRDVRFYGFGEPNVHLNPMMRGAVLDMAAKNVRFEHVRLNAQGVKLMNGEDHCADTEIY